MEPHFDFFILENGFIMVNNQNGESLYPSLFGIVFWREGQGRT